MQPTTRTQVPLQRDGGIWTGPYILRNWSYFWVAFITFVWATPSFFGLFICGGVALHSLRGTRQSVEALGILAFLLVSLGTDVSMGRWVILFTAASRMIWDGAFTGQSVPPLIYPLVLFYVIILLLSGFASQFPLVSGLKVTSFIFGVGVLTTGFFRTRHLQDYWLSWLLTLGVFVLLASVPFYGLEAGYRMNDVGFQGILAHPQTFGPVAASITALLTGLYFFRQRTSWLILLSLGVGWIGVYFSFSRTSLLSLLLAGVGTAIVGLSLKPQTWSRDLTRALRRPAVMAGILAVFVAGILQWMPLQSTTETVPGVHEEDASLLQVLERSRGSLMDQSIANFWTKPATGIGFGVPSGPDGFAGQLERGALGIPLSASVEKGFMPTAVLEETGIIGAILTIVLLLFLVAPVLRHPDPTLFWIMATCLLVNFGEMVFFSIGGLGFFLWFMMSFCYVAALDRPRRRQPERPSRRQPVRAQPLKHADAEPR